jgi:hypothetical protein
VPFQPSWFLLLREAARQYDSVTIELRAPFARGPGSHRHFIVIHAGSRRREVNNPEREK